MAKRTTHSTAHGTMQHSTQHMTHSTVHTLAHARAYNAMPAAYAHAHTCAHSPPHNKHTYTCVHVSSAAVVWPRTAWNHKAHGFDATVVANMKTAAQNDSEMLPFHRSVNGISASSQHVRGSSTSLVGRASSASSLASQTERGPTTFESLLG